MFLFVRARFKGGNYNLSITMADTAVERPVELLFFDTFSHEDSEVIR